MTIRTKKYKLTPSKYVQLAFWNIIRKNWWIGLIGLAITAFTAYIGYVVTAILLLFLMIVLLVIIWLQLYSVTKMEDSRLMFERLFYEISRERIVMFLNTKQGMPIDWKHIVSAKVGKDYFMLNISIAQFIYLPHSIFQGEQQINLVRMVLKNKKLI